MQIRMTADEIVLFRSFLVTCTSYLEFGIGGSTVLASSLVNGPVVGVESSETWNQVGG